MFTVSFHTISYNQKYLIDYGQCDELYYVIRTIFHDILCYLICLWVVLYHTTASESISCRGWWTWTCTAYGDAINAWGLAWSRIWCCHKIVVWIVWNITASYGNVSITKTITVKTQSILNVKIASVNDADDVMVYVTLIDFSDKKLTGDVMLEINGNYYRIIVKDSDGSWKPWPVQTGIIYQLFNILFFLINLLNL